MNISGDSSVPFATLLTASRFLGNAFRHEPLRIAFYGGQRDLAGLLMGLRGLAAHGNKQVRVAVSAAVLNAALLIASGGLRFEAADGTAHSFFLLISDILRYSSHLENKNNDIKTIMSELFFLLLLNSDILF